MAAGAGRVKQTNKSKGAANDAVEQPATAESAASRSSVAARKASISSVSTSNPGSRATSPYSLSASNEILGMLQQPGGAVKLPSFRKKSAASKSGEASTAMSKKQSISTSTTSSSSIASTPATAKKPKKKASTSFQKKSKYSAGTATPPIEWTSSENEQEADATVVMPRLDKGKGRATGQEASATDVHNDMRSAATGEHSMATSLHSSTLSSQQSGLSASLRYTSPAPAPSISHSVPPGRPPDQAERVQSPDATLSNPPLAAHSKPSRPSTTHPSPAATALASGRPDVKAVPTAEVEGISDSEASDQEDLTFSLDAQLQAALSDTAVDTTRQADTTPAILTSGSDPVAINADNTASASILDSAIPAADASNDGSDEDAFDFDKQLAAALDASGPPEASEPDQMAPATLVAGTESLPATAVSKPDSDSEDDDDEEVFDLDKALAAAVNPKGAEAPDVSQVPSAADPAANFQRPAVSLDVASDDDSDDEAFDLDKELAAAIKPTPNSSAALGPQDKESDAEDDVFDFDTHLAAALNATPSSNTALLSMEVDPALQALLVSPAAVTASLGAIGDDLPSSHLASGTLGSSSILQQVIPLPSPPCSEEDEDSDEADETAFDLNAMLATAMTKEPEVKAEQDVAASLAADVQATLGEAFASAAVAAEVDSDSESSAPVAESEDDNEDDVEMTFDLDAHLQAAMSGQLEIWGDGDAVPVPGLDLNMQAPSFAQTNSVDGAEDSNSDLDEATGFDLDAQIGAAMRSVSVDDSRQSSVVQPAVPLSSGPAQAGGFAQSDLQNMLKGALRQAALEIELDIDDLNEAEFDDLMDFDDDEDLLNDQGQGLYDHVPSKPRMRPEMKDNGNPTNAFNTARIANPQALHTFYPCEYPGCERVYARMKNRDKHRATHIQDASKPFACPHCPLRFATPQDSQEHLLTHNQTREWRYRCRGCHNLFGTKAMLDKHAFSAACQEVQTVETERCRKGIFTLAFRPLGKLYPTQFPAHPAQNHLQLPPAPPGPAYNAFFEKTPFDHGHLLAAALVSQLSTLIAQQYDRQNSLRAPTDPIINIPLAMSQTIKRANLTPKECAALASILATVGHARNEGLKASLAEARKVQIENLRRQHQHQDRIRAEIMKRETDRQRVELERRTKLEQEKRDRAKARRDALIGDIPVPQAEIP